MSNKTWVQRNGSVFGVLIGLVVLLGYLHTTIGSLQDEMRSNFSELRASNDRIETKVDEVRGYLRMNVSAPPGDNPPANAKN